MRIFNLVMGILNLAFAAFNFVRGNYGFGIINLVAGLACITTYLIT